MELMRTAFIAAMLLGAVSVLAQTPPSTVNPGIPVANFPVEQSGGALRQNFLATMNDINTLYGLKAISTGMPPVNSGLCPITNQVGGNTAGIFTTAANCPGTNAFIFTFNRAAPNGWVCFGTDRTNVTGPITQTASTPTTATFASGIGIASVIQFSCTGY
jgi:hypothetical protein